jgi:hypothetical protein
LIARFERPWPWVTTNGKGDGRRAGQAAYVEAAVERWRSPHHLLLWEARGLTVVR